MTSTTSGTEALVARNAVGVVFALNGLCFATWVSRIPEVRADLGLTNGQLGLLLLCLAAGSVLSLPTTGAFINRFGTGTVVRAGASSAAAGLLAGRRRRRGRPGAADGAWACSPTASAPGRGTCP